MAYISWSEDLSVGNRFIDADHRQIINIINRLHDAMQERRANEVLENVLFDLVVYTKGHFQREEDHMKAIDFPGFARHQREHQALLEQLAALRQQFKDNPSHLSITTAQFLHGWLTQHILGSDMELSASLSKAGLAQS
jgi:hemerythrin